STAVATVVKIGADRIRADSDFACLGQDSGSVRGLGCPLAERVAQALLCELVLRIQVQGVAEFGQGFHLLAFQQCRVSTLQMVEHYLLASHFSRRQIDHVLWSEPSGVLELVQSLICTLFAL